MLRNVVKYVRNRLIIFMLSLLLLEGILRLAEPYLDFMHRGQIPSLSYHLYDYIEDGSGGDLYLLTTLSYTSELEKPYRVYFTLDQYGFRGNPESDVLVVGDSFTLGAQIPRPYWTAVDGYAIAKPGIGGGEELRLLKAHGFDHPRRYVIWAYFEGNDLGDTLRETRSPKKLYIQRVLSAIFYGEPQIPYEFGVHYTAAPIRTEAGQELVFYWPYIHVLTRSRDEVLTSDEWKAVSRVIVEAADWTQAHGATFVLMFIPSKVGAYYDLLTPEALERIRASVGEDGDIPMRFFDNADTQRNLLAELAQAHGFLYLDLTGPFRVAAGEGESLYFRGDTHWNRAGHSLAGTVLKQFLGSLDESES